MKKRFSNKLLMFWAVLKVLAKFKTVWESIPGFTMVHKEFEAAVGAIQKTSTASNIKTGEITKGAAQSIDAVVILVFKLTSLLSVFATRTRNHELKNDVDFTESELEYMRPGELLGVAELVLELIPKYQTELVALGLNDADVTTLSAYVNGFTGATTATRSTITARKAAGALLKPQFAETGEILKEQLDGLMEQFRTSSPAFYNEYWNARKTMDYGIRHEKEEENAKKE